MNRSEILDEAKRLTTGDRQKQYGDAAQNYKAVGDLWGAYILALLTKNGFEIIDADGKEIDLFAIPPEDTLIMLTLMKIGREVSGNSKDDNFVDAAGYLALAGEVATGGEENHA
jgi:hypothetical protein